MISSFLEKVYDYIKDNSSSTTTTTTTETTTPTSTSSSTGTTFSKTVTEATIVPFMTLTDGQVNTFEGVMTASSTNQTYSNTNVELYVKIVACGDYIINPFFYTDGDVLLTVEPLVDDDIVLYSFTIEVTTNSPTDYYTV